MTSRLTNGSDIYSTKKGFSLYAGQTDPGRIRSKNEDNLGIFPEQGLFFVADGVGGMPAGEIASMLVVEVLPALIEQRLELSSETEFKSFTQNEIILRLKQAVIDLSNRIATDSQKHPEYAGMASTLVLVLFTEKNLYFAHLGDSRAYLLQDESLKQMTNDHTLVRHLLQVKAITQEEAVHHPGKNQLVQYIGMSMAPGPDVICIPRKSGEKVLLCSDGLTDMLSKQEITQFLMKNSTPETICKALIKAANLAGGKDNITVVVVE
ncbi:MAG: Stp1/IreP family PP2C-type Ser/Thr phosphatase [Gammaproteobacteria bacterium]|nr:Stp1/IreP family PP2C-type Ser/Thr phosphatase [Gammaproteobacteria bacterium]